MRSTPDLDEKLRLRLQEAVDRFADGSADAFGRLIGYANGGYIRQSLRTEDARPVRSSLIARINDVPAMRGWFESVLPPLVASDLRQQGEYLPPQLTLQTNAHASQGEAKPFMLPSLMSWEQVMQSQELPDRFVFVMPDDALAPSLARGTEVVFRRAAAAEPGECVLVQDGRGSRYVRRYVQGVGSGWTAQAIDSAYVSLDSQRDDLQVLAVLMYRAQSRV